MTATQDNSLPDFAVEVTGLTKIYPGNKKTGEKHALKGIDLTVERGSLFALLGPNGAGKSSLINILAGLVNRTGGVARVWGYDTATEARRARAAIGVVPQELNLDAFFTPRELLEQQAGFYGVPKKQRRTMELLEAVGLSDKADAYARSLSGGMRRRLMVAKAMVHAPPVLVLDEPTAGVDVELRQMLWAHVRDLNARGTTVLLTTHYLEEAEELCDTIAIINHGEVVCCEPKRQLLSRIDRKDITLTLDKDIARIPAGLDGDGLSASMEGPRILTVRYRPSDNASGRIIDAVREAGYDILDLETRQTDLEDIFLELTSTRDAA